MRLTCAVQQNLPLDLKSCYNVQSYPQISIVDFFLYEKEILSSQALQQQPIDRSLPRHPSNEYQDSSPHSFSGLQNQQNLDSIPLQSTPSYSAPTQTHAKYQQQQQQYQPQSQSQSQLPPGSLPTPNSAGSTYLSQTPMSTDTLSPITANEAEKAYQFFLHADLDKDGILSGSELNLFSRFKLPQEELSHVLRLADLDHDNCLTWPEFLLALMACRRCTQAKIPVPPCFSQRFIESAMIEARNLIAIVHSKQTPTNSGLSPAMSASPRMPLAVAISTPSNLSMAPVSMQSTPSYIQSHGQQVHVAHTTPSAGYLGTPLSHPYDTVNQGYQQQQYQLQTPHHQSSPSQITQSSQIAPSSDLAIFSQLHEGTGTQSSKSTASSQSPLFAKQDSLSILDTSRESPELMGNSQVVMMIEQAIKALESSTEKTEEATRNALAECVSLSTTEQAQTDQIAELETRARVATQTLLAHRALYNDLQQKVREQEQRRADTEDLARKEEEAFKNFTGTDITDVLKQSSTQDNADGTVIEVPSIVSLREALEAETLLNHKAHERILAAKAARDRLLVEESDISSRVLAITQDTETISAEVYSMEDEIEKLTQSIAKTKIHLSDLEMDFAAVENSKRDASSRLKALNLEIQQLTTTVQVTKASQAHTEMEYSEVLAQEESLLSKRALLQVTLEDLQEQVHSTEQNLVKAKSHTQDLTAQNLILEESIATLSENTTSSSHIDTDHSTGTSGASVDVLALTSKPTSDFDKLSDEAAAVGFLNEEELEFAINGEWELPEDIIHDDLQVEGMSNLFDDSFSNLNEEQHVTKPVSIPASESFPDVMDMNIDIKIGSVAVVGGDDVTYDEDGIAFSRDAMSSVTGSVHTNAVDSPLATASGVGVGAGAESGSTNTEQEAGKKDVGVDVDVDFSSLVFEPMEDFGDNFDPFADTTPAPAMVMDEIPIDFEADFEVDEEISKEDDNDKSTAPLSPEFADTKTQATSPSSPVFVSAVGSGAASPSHGEADSAPPQEQELVDDKNENEKNETVLNPFETDFDEMDDYPFAAPLDDDLLALQDQDNDEEEIDYEPEVYIDSDVEEIHQTDQGNSSPSGTTTTTTKPETVMFDVSFPEEELKTDPQQEEQKQEDVKQDLELQLEAEMELEIQAEHDISQAQDNLMVQNESFEIDFENDFENEDQDQDQDVVAEVDVSVDVPVVEEVKTLETLPNNSSQSQSQSQSKQIESNANVPVFDENDPFADATVNFDSMAAFDEMAVKNEAVDDTWAADFDF